MMKFTSRARTVQLLRRIDCALKGPVVRSLPAAARPQQQASFHTTRWQAQSDGSHDDFAPKRKTVQDDEVQTMIASHIQDNPVMLYMKGTPSTPMCGFSAQVVSALKAEGVDFSSVNVLDYPSIREGIKVFSDWPTIPQLYVNGEFIGGCDIVMGMHGNGELKDLLLSVKESSE